MKLYPGARHELLNETNKEEVMADLARWLHQQLPPG
jgi:alpha-beta hydrolase superfamily lysophospholipase